MPPDRWVYIIVAIGSVVLAIDTWVHRVNDTGKRLKTAEAAIDALEQALEAEGKAVRFLIDKANQTFSQKSSEMQTRCGQIELMLNTLNTLEGERRPRGGNKR